MIIPDEVKEYIKKCIAEETNYLVELITNLNKIIEKLKVEIAILKDGGNI